MKKLFALFGCALAALSAAGAYEVLPIINSNSNLEDQWKYILPGRPPQIRVRTEVWRGERFKVNFFIRNPVKDEKGKSQIELLELTTTDPKGKITSLVKNQPLLVDGNLAPNTMYMTGMHLTIEFDPPDLDGLHTFTVKTRDVLDKSERTDTCSVTLKPAAKLDTTPMQEKEFDRYLRTYYDSSDAKKILSAYAAVLDHDAKKIGQKNYSPLNLLAAFYFILQENPALIPEFEKFTYSGNPLQKEYTGMIVKFLKNKDDKDNPFVFEKAETPGQLDILWSEFFITGRRLPFEKLLNALKYGENKDTSKIMHMATVWSCESNVIRQRLLLFYLEAMLKRNEIKDPYVKSEAQKIFDNIIAKLKEFQEKAKQQSAKPKPEPEKK